MVHKKNATRQIIFVFVSMIGVMIVGILFGSQRVNMDDWDVFEFRENAEDVRFEIEFDANEIHAVLVNDSDGEVGFGQEFALMKLSGGVWRVFPFYNIAINDIMYILPPGHRAENVFILREDMFAARFMPGIYRIATTVWTDDSSAQVWGEFELSPRN